MVNTVIMSIEGPVRKEWQAVSFQPEKEELTFALVSDDGSLENEVKEYSLVIGEITDFVWSHVESLMTRRHLQLAVEEAVANIKRYGFVPGEPIDTEYVKISAAVESLVTPEGKSAKVIDLRFYDQGPKLPKTPEELAADALTPEGLEKGNGRGFCIMIDLAQFRVLEKRNGSRTKCIQLLRVMEIDSED